MKAISLPKKYEYKEGVSRHEYKKFDGWNKISYSQKNSFKDYKLGYIRDYILGLGDGESGIFANFGSDCGDYLNPYDERGEYPLLSNEDIAILDIIKNTHPKNAEFEYEILIDLEPFGLEKTCLQAFTDRQYLTEEGKVNVSDYKTLTVKTKKAYYESDEYEQLSVYGYGLEELGFTIGEMWVDGLGRSGNTTEKGNKNVLRLSGEIIRVDKPYDRKKAIKVLQSIADICIEISEYWKLYQTNFAQKK